VGTWFRDKNAKKKLKTEGGGGKTEKKNRWGSVWPEKSDVQSQGSKVSPDPKNSREKKLEGGKKGPSGVYGQRARDRERGKTGRGKASGPGAIVANKKGERSSKTELAKGPKGSQSGVQEGTGQSLTVRGRGERAPGRGTPHQNSREKDCEVPGEMPRSKKKSLS